MTNQQPYINIHMHIYTYSNSHAKLIPNSSLRKPNKKQTHKQKRSIPTQYPSKTSRTTQAINQKEQIILILNKFTSWKIIFDSRNSRDHWYYQQTWVCSWKFGDQLVFEIYCLAVCALGWEIFGLDFGRNFA